VILGLICVSISNAVPSLGFLEKADAIAASIVAVIVIYVSVKMGLRTIYALLDTAPKGLVVKIKAAVESVPGVSDCHNVRLRYSGPLLFVDAHVLVDGDQTLTEAHVLTEKIEKAICEIAPGADVTVHPEPAGT
jgi:cation diffusion facilitator family transporter